jgi:hypothetical protein
MMIGFVTPTFDLGRDRCSMRARRFGAGQGDLVDAGVNLGPAK